MDANLFTIDSKPVRYYGKRLDMVSYIPHNVHTLLDVGCGDGQFGYTCKQTMNVEFWGIELFAKEAEKAKGRLDTILVGDIECDELALPEYYFDCIIFNDVLEHLRYPWIVLNKIKQYLKPDGYVVASIPNIRYYEIAKRYLLNKDWQYVDYGVMDKTHLRFFTIVSIRTMFERCGYSIVILEGIKHITFPWKFNLLNRFLNNRLDDMRYLQFACVAKL
jgi:2-polyprenyl-3-methyl-5-hydroxy-6-metoxy-1,4-benzoquinol methylase